MSVNKFDLRKPYRFVKYGRMSTDRQNPRSPEQQFATIDETLARQNLPWVHVADYRDDAISGRYVLRRTGLQNLLQDIRSGALGIDLIVVDTFERFGRADELAEIRRELERDYGVVIVTADTGFADPTTPTGKVMGFFENFRATEDTRIKGHNVRRGKRDAVRQKKWPGGDPPFGYKLEPVFKTTNGRQEVDFNRLVVDDRTAWIVLLLYQKAADTGWGQTRLADFFNNNEEIPPSLKPFQGHTVRYILRNEIYYGDFVYHRTSSAIIQDRRVNLPNEPEDMIREADYCEPIVPKELWDAVARLRAIRSERGRASRVERNGAADEKLLKPLAPGMTLDYPLSGLVVCGECGRAMTPSPSPIYTTKAGEEKRYVSYACPGPGCGLCPNRTRIPEPFLRRTVANLIRKRVLGLSGQEEGSPRSPDLLSPGMQELIAEVQRELADRQRQKPSRVPALQSEIDALNAQIQGWTLSLAKPDLSGLVRATIEQSLDEGLIRRQTLESDLHREQLAAEHGMLQADVSAIQKCLDELEEVLGGDNATLTNIELGLHIDRIECFPDDRVQIRTCRLGALAGAVTLLREDSHSQEDGSREKESKTKWPAKPRRRGRRATNGAVPSDRNIRELVEFSTDPERFAGLPDKWFWTDEFKVPRRVSWVEAHADEVASYQQTHGASTTDLMKVFGKSRPTILKALRIATGRRQEGRAAQLDAGASEQGVDKDPSRPHCDSPAPGSDSDSSAGADGPASNRS